MHRRVASVSRGHLPFGCSQIARLEALCEPVKVEVDNGSGEQRKQLREDEAMISKKPRNANHHGFQLLKVRKGPLELDSVRRGVSEGIKRTSPAALAA